MDIVIDTSAIIAVIANEPERPAIIAATQDADLIAPGSVHWEIGNAFTAMLRRRRVSVAQSLRALDVYHTIPIRFVDVELTMAIEIAADVGSYAYDAYLIRCAQKHRAPLLTLDRELLDAARRSGVSVIEVSP